MISALLEQVQKIKDVFLTSDYDDAEQGWLVEDRLQEIEDILLNESGPFTQYEMGVMDAIAVVDNMTADSTKVECGIAILRLLRQEIPE